MQSTPKATDGACTPCRKSATTSWSSPSASTSVPGGAGATAGGAGACASAHSGQASNLRTTRTRISSVTGTTPSVPILGSFVGSGNSGRGFSDMLAAAGDRVHPACAVDTLVDIVQRLPSRSFVKGKFGEAWEPG